MSLPMALEGIIEQVKKNQRMIAKQAEVLDILEARGVEGIEDVTGTFRIIARYSSYRDSPTSIYDVALNMQRRCMEAVSQLNLVRHQEKDSYDTVLILTAVINSLEPICGS